MHIVRSSLALWERASTSCVVSFTRRSSLNSISWRNRLRALSVLRAAFDRVMRHRALREEVAAHEIERSSLHQQSERLRSSLRGLSPTDQATIKRQASYETEQRTAQALEREAKTAKQALEAVASEFSQIPKPIDPLNTPVNGDLLKSSFKAFETWVVDARAALGNIQNAFVVPLEEKALGQYFGGIAEWRRLRDEHRKHYEEAKTRAATHEETLRQIQRLETRLAEINEAADEKSQQIARLGEPETDFEALRTQWKTVHRTRAKLLEGQCQALSRISSSRLRATLRPSADTGSLSERLRQLIKGTGTRGERIDRLVDQLRSSADALETWHIILDEFLKLAWLRMEDEAVTPLPPVPWLDNAGFTQKEKIAISSQLNPLSWLELLLFDLKDLPVFEYQVRQDDFLPFDHASPGQQATALLSILLLQDGPPLVIDQPEDDLNMRIINEIVETLWSAKTHRQVIFSSHNANLVVNGDAELVVCGDYRPSATESLGQIKLTGAIDMPEINREITDVMEGGVEAFKLRQQKYGF